MQINYDIERLNEILQDFSNACGINIIIVDKNFSILSKKWRKNNRYCYTIQSFQIRKNQNIKEKVKYIKLTTLANK